MLIVVEATLRVMDTLVPLMFMSDRTHRSNFAGDKKESPVYMTIGNLSWMIPQMASTKSVIIVTLLPNPIVNCNILQKWLNWPWQTNREVLNEVLWRILQPLTFIHKHCAESRYYNVLHTDGRFRRCKPVLAAWLGDCPEYSDLHHLECRVCFWWVSNEHS